MPSMFVVTLNLVETNFNESFFTGFSLPIQRNNYANWLMPQLTLSAPIPIASLQTVYLGYRSKQIVDSVCLMMYILKDCSL